MDDIYRKEINYEYFLPKMKKLTTLRIYLDKSMYPNIVNEIYSHCK